MARLNDWPQITKNITRMEQLLEADQKMLNALDGPIEERTRGSDPTAKTAIKLLERRDALTGSIQVWEQRIADERRTLTQIESAVAQLNERDQEMIRRFYFQQERWESIAIGMHLSRSRFYELLERARSKIEWWLTQDENRDQDEKRDHPRGGGPA